MGLGITNIGENRIQESEEKLKKLKKGVEKHFIGHLQTNKAKKAVKIFDVIQTIDSEKIIKKVNKEAKKQEKEQKVMIQVNTGRDENKYGFMPEEINNLELLKYKNIKIVGIMTIAPQNKTKKELKKIFRETKEIQKKIQKKIKSCTQISMGMSGDYKEAIEEGATHIRIGTGIFGKRK